MSAEAAQSSFTWRPNPGPQTQFLASAAFEVLFGGSAGGSKTESLIVAPLRWVHHPEFRAIIMRRTFPELEKSVIDRSRQIYPAVVPGAAYNAQEKLWRFPSGARIYFGHAEHEHSVHQYQGAAFSFFGFDELTHFTESQYRYMLSRARSSAGLPVRIRAATNPGGPGAEWVFKRWAPWLDPKSQIRALPGRVLHYRNTEGGEQWADDGELSRVFIPSKLEDNPHLALNDPQYRQRLMGLDAVTRAQLLHGDWLARPAPGMYYRRAWFKFVDKRPALPVLTVRRWDLASTEGGGDWTIGAKMSLYSDNTVCLEHVERAQLSPQGVETLIKSTAASDGPLVHVSIPQDPGQAGKAQVAGFARMLAGYVVKSAPETGDKVTRQEPFSAQCEAGNVSVVRGDWWDSTIQILEAFPSPGVHDDDVDAIAGAFGYLADSMADQEYLRALGVLGGEIKGQP